MKKDKKALVNVDNVIRGPKPNLRKHRYPMLSLDKAYTKKEIKEFYTRVCKAIPKKEVNFIVEQKLDGMALSCLYENGYFKQAITRGNGVWGEDISEYVKEILKPQIDNLNTCPSIEIEGPVELRGELFLNRLVFEELRRNKKDKKIADFEKNKKLWIDLIAEYGKVFFYDVITNPRVMSTETTLNYLAWNGLKIPHHTILNGVNGNKLYDASIALMYICKTQSDLESPPYDGVVIKVNSYEAKEKLGATSANYRWAIALKVG